MRKLVHVTQDDIDTATRDLSMREFGVTPDRCRVCPIAKAMRRETEEDDVMVSDRLAWIRDRRVYLPRSAIRFINRYDHKRPVDPFNFIMKG